MEKFSYTKHFQDEVGAGDYRCLGKVVRQLPKSSLWKRWLEQELWAAASAWHQKNDLKAHQGWSKTID